VRACHSNIDVGESHTVYNNDNNRISIAPYGGNFRGASVQSKTRSSADADKPARRIYRSAKVTKHITIPYVRYSFLLSNSNFVFKTRRFYDIRLQKCRDLENWVRDPSRSLEMSPCDRAHTTSYWRSVVTVALSRVVSEIFNVKKCRDLEIGVKCHSRSLKVVPFGRLFIVSY